MPPALVKAHNELDKAVDAAYSKQNFSTESKRMEFLFELYEKYTADLFTKEKPKKTKKTGSGGLTAAAGFGILPSTFAPVVELADT